MRFTGTNILPRGFTLVEMLIVMGIFATLSIVGFSGYGRYTQAARDDRRISDVNTIRTQLELYRNMDPNRAYPVTYPTLRAFSSNQLPRDPKTNADYSYTSLPSGCNNSSIFCSSYEVRATFEARGTSYIAQPRITQIITTPSPSPSRAPSPTGIPTPTRRPTPIAMHTPTLRPSNTLHPTLVGPTFVRPSPTLVPSCGGNSCNTSRPCCAGYTCTNGRCVQDRFQVM